MIRPITRGHAFFSNHVIITLKGFFFIIRRLTDLKIYGDKI